MRWACRRRPPTSPSRAGCGCRCATASTWSPTTTRRAPTTPAGTLLVRGPTAAASRSPALFGAVYAARGYHVVFQSVRGTFGSGGRVRPDGQRGRRRRRHRRLAARPAVVHRLVRHHRAVLPRLHPVGAADRPATGADGRGHHRRPARLQRTPGAPARSASTTSSAGATWCRHQEDPNRLRAAAPAGPRPAAGHRGIAGAAARRPPAAALLGDGAPWFESWLDHPDRDDPFWARVRLRDALDRAEVPVLLFSGWQDLFVDQTVEQYRHAARPRRDHRPDRRPVDARPDDDQGRPDRAAGIAGLARPLTSAARPPQRRSPVRVHVGRAGLARPARLAAGDARSTCCTSHPADGLADGRARRRRTRRTFVYNPADPTPTVGGRLLSPTGGYRDDTAARAPRRRADVHRRPAGRRPLRGRRCRCSSWRIRATTRTTTCSSGSARSTRTAAPATSATGTWRAAPDSGTVRIELDPVARTVPGRVTDPAADRRRLASPLPAQPGHRRISDPAQRLFATARHTVHLGAGIPADAARRVRSRRQPTERAHPPAISRQCRRRRARGRPRPG